MISSVESHLDRTFEEAARRLEEEMMDNEYNYLLEPTGHMVDFSRAGESGRCRCFGVEYNRTLDCNIFRMLDLDTEHEFIVDEFEIKLELI